MSAVDRRPHESPRDALIGAVLEFLSSEDLPTREDIRHALEHELSAAGDTALAGLQQRLTTDLGWDYYPSDPLARRIHHLLADRFLEADSTVVGTAHLDAVRDKRVAIFSNHLSYADANVIELLLHRCGASDMARRFTAVAGPKIFSSRQRRFSSLCFGTIKVPQSAEVSTGEAVLNQREVARAARRAIEVAHARLAAGDVLLVFGEGTRSRSGELQPMLPGVARYLGAADIVVLPVGLTGSEQLYPVNDTSLRPARVVMTVGAPLSVERLMAAADGERRVAMDAIGLSIANLLPARYRGVYAVADDFPDARRAMHAASGHELSHT
ncbi:MAG: lysophospholipid acyltransferase family protein [Vicinamibacterales bacterium]